MPNNSQIQVQDLGRNGDALIAVTEYENCCRDQRRGEFVYPNGNLVGRDSDGQPFYRNRGVGEVRLNQRNSVLDEEKTLLLGRFGCEILDGCGEVIYLSINIGKLLFLCVNGRGRVFNYKGHFGTRKFVRYREVVLFRRLVQ